MRVAENTGGTLIFPLTSISNEIDWDELIAGK
jgi:hypothetical protein